MRFTLALLAFGAFSTASAGLVSRQASLPNCAVACLIDANFGSCSSQDDACLCNDSAFVQSSTSCIQSSCTGSDLTNAEAAAQEMCAAVGVTLATASATTTSPTTTASSTTSPSPSASSNGATSHGISILAGSAAFAVLAASF
ncbi:hypothetical protein SERLA73DRAFT_179413 [Serpula lacrymans var. lacrymans S7.3]|uniref:CFEM domain-containing protein n=1 Tax=Serpula lacrymans var. lacrymans (strain S7.3) TaxID=936435 RepID=F8PS86_SERL3|nr:hypothetical protein SERLA73DRAFT_179413 [Serpula lacrymans var. lacrymans S7.3]